MHREKPKPTPRIWPATLLLPAAASLLAATAPFASARTVAEHCNELAVFDVAMTLVVANDVLPPDVNECESRSIYYESTEHRDDARARQCAFREMQQGSSHLIADRAVLAMIYANGRGVPRNTLLAKKFLCELSDTLTPLDLAALLDVVDHIAADPKATPELDVCANPRPQGFDTQADFADGANLGDECRDFGHDIVERDSQRSMRQTLQRWNAAARTAFTNDTLPATERLLEAARTHEYDGDGAFSVLDAGRWWQDLRQHQLYAIVAAVDQGDSPAASAQTLADAEGAMASTLQSLRTTARAASRNGRLYGTVAMNGVEQVQQHWLACRDAWLRTAALQWPSADTTPLRLQLTRLRVSQLKALAAGAEDVSD
jgi:hypothetical protein